MTRRKSRHARPKVRLADEQILAGIERDLKTLEALVRSYDDGHTAGAPTMATVIENIVLVEGRVALERRGKLSFPSPPEQFDTRMMNSGHRLISMRVRDDEKGMTVEALPWFSRNMMSTTRLHSFRTWWDGEPIYVGGNSRSAPTAGIIALDLADQLTWDEREKFTRRSLINDLRNSIGSHPDLEIPALLHEVYQADSFASFAMEGPDGEPTTEGIVYVTLPAEAAVRQISEELLHAYGCR